MKQVLALALSLAMGASAFAAPAPQTSSSAAGTTKKTSRTRKKMAAGPSVNTQLDEMKQAIDAQQQQLQQLRQELQTRDQAIQQLQQRLDQSQTTATQAASKADQVASQAEAQNATVNSLKSDLSDLKTYSNTSALNLQESQKEIQKTNEAIKLLGKLKMTGDLRLRYEPFFGGGAQNKSAPEPRNRERYRLRFNVNTDITPDFSAGFSLASGDIGDPISTNQTETGFFVRTPINIDRAFAVYKPHQFKPFSLTAGKFAYTWQRTELTWDNDLNPEGGSANLSWDWKNRFINHFGVVALGLPLFEVSSGPDTYMLGGQVQTGWTLLPKVKLTADAAYYDFENADSIAQNQVGGNGFATSGLPTTAGGTFGFGGSTNTNNFGADASGKRFYASKFGIFDALARLDFNSGSKRWPVYALFDFVQNTQACDNASTFARAGLAFPTCDRHQRHGYWGELKAGQTKNKGDLLLGYTFARIERDAVLAAFDFSDLRQATNVVEHRIEVYYQAYPHVQIGWTGLIGRQLITAQSSTPERWLKRFQFDSIFSF